MTDGTSSESRPGGADYCYLTTFGRVSGKPREIEIWFVRSGDTLYLLSGGGRKPDWVRNLLANPTCEARLGSRDADPLRGVARLLDMGDVAAESRRARDLVYAKYQVRYDGDLSDWRERALPVALDLMT